MVSIGAKTAALEVKKRVQALEKAAGRNFGRRGSREEKKNGDRLIAVEQKDWISFSHTFSSLRAVRYLGFVDSLVKFCVNATAYHIAAGSGTSIAGSSCRRRATSISSPNDMFHSGVDTSSNCQVSDYVDKKCALVELLGLCVSSEIVSNEVFFKFLEKLGERSPLARRAVRASRGAIPLSPLEPACHVELSAFQSKVQSSLCPSSSAVVINDGADVPPAWWCESCRQTTLVDGVVLRSALRIRRAACLR